MGPVDGSGGARAAGERRAEGVASRRDAAVSDALRACVADVLGVEVGTVPPLVADDPLVPLADWLAGRRLGLVQVRDPERFGWPARWIALREPVPSLTPRPRPVVMFGSPPGPVLDPLRDVAGEATGAIVEALVIAPLDVRPTSAMSSGRHRTRGVVEALVVAPAAGVAAVAVATVAARPGGLEGDRYALGRGTFSGSAHRGHDLTLIESEALEELATRGAIRLGATDARRNVVTRGIDLAVLVGRSFTIGGVECYGQRAAEPCLHLERLTKPGVLRGLIHRGGLRADIVTAGSISVGDVIAIAAAPDSGGRSGAAARARDRND